MELTVLEDSRAGALDFRSPVPGWAPPRRSRTLPRVRFPLLRGLLSSSLVPTPPFQVPSDYASLSLECIPPLAPGRPALGSFTLSLSVVCFEICRPRWCPPFRSPRTPPRARRSRCNDGSEQLIRWRGSATPCDSVAYRGSRAASRR